MMNKTSLTLLIPPLFIHLWGVEGGMWFGSENAIHCYDYKSKELKTIHIEKKKVKVLIRWIIGFRKCFIWKMAKF